MSRVRLAVGAAAVVLAAGVLAGCGDSDSGGETSSKPAGGDKAAAAEASTSTAPAEVKIVKAGYEDHETWGEHAYVVYWELTNTGSEQGNFYAGLDFLDADGDVVGSTGLTADKVGPGKTAKGNLAPLDVEIDKGDINAIKGVRVAEIERHEF
ncbi:hypothetical protein H114_00817 [Streptomyces gancidicus BKS 13-15]|uniref:Lipoprotein n=1 Tax=Streptomyces gancidicus BKS 13-15 TaxID=1284664 RepID=M3EDH1_STREZ|nr:hypothetical protein [Streptomyces gancidicus]EMF31126.1 hypothetical protein H114_00817 [Streptomyces gancidicus BKS 13-15]